MRTLLAVALGFLAACELHRRSMKPVETEAWSPDLNSCPMTEAILAYQDEAAFRAARQ